MATDRSSTPESSRRLRSTFRVGGMLVGYYVVCPRKAWLSMRGLWMEQDSTTVALGRLIGASSYARKKKELLLTAESPCGTPLVGKIDWADLNGGILHETKKSRAQAEAHREQLRFYLWLLRLNGVTRTDGTSFEGELNVPRHRRTERVTLTESDEDRLAAIVAALRNLFEQPHPPPRRDARSFCRRCAYEELCYG